jgi:hypothetical protein
VTFLLAHNDAVDDVIARGSPARDAIGPVTLSTGVDPTPDFDAASPVVAVEVEATELAITFESPLDTVSICLASIFATVITALIATFVTAIARTCFGTGNCGRCCGKSQKAGDE